MNKIISVFGSPLSGKTTFIMKASQYLSSFNKRVIIIFANMNCPHIPMLSPDKNFEDKSLGKLLSDITISQDDIKRTLIIHSSNANIGILSYLQSENSRTYSDFTKERIADFLNLLRPMADYILIENSFFLENDFLNYQLLSSADKIITLIRPSLSDVLYYQSLSPFLSEIENLNSDIKVISLRKDEDGASIIKDKMGAEYEIIYLESLENQMKEASLFRPLTGKDSQYYKDSLKKIITLATDEKQADEIISNKQGLFARFKNNKKINKAYTVSDKKKGFLNKLNKKDKSKLSNNTKFIPFNQNIKKQSFFKKIKIGFKKSK